MGERNRRDEKMKGRGRGSYPKWRAERAAMKGWPRRGNRGVREWLIKGDIVGSWQGCFGISSIAVTGKVPSDFGG